MHLFMLGVHHERAPIAIRENLAFNGEDLAAGLRELSQIAREAVILSTCNRTEVYGLFDDEDGIEVLRDYLAASRDIPRDRLDAMVDAYEGRAAARHMFRVASGLDSLMLGEPQILTQIQQAMAAARHEGSAGPILMRLCHDALRTGKFARTRTSIARNRQSISHAAVDLAARKLGGLRDRRAVVIGAGQIGTLTARILRNTGVSDLVIVNRSADRGRALAESTGGRYVSLGGHRGDLARADALFTAATSSEYLVSREAVEERELPLVAVDLAVPRVIDPSLDAYPNVLLFTVDHLDAIAAEHRERYECEIAKVEEIVTDATDAFCSWLRERSVVPTITALRGRGEDIRQTELDRALRRLGHLSERDRAQVEALSVAIVNKLLHRPVAQLKADAGHDAHEESERVLRQLFGIEAGEGTDLSP